MPMSSTRALSWKLLALVCLVAAPATAGPVVKLQDPIGGQGLQGILPGAIPSGANFKAIPPKPNPGKSGGGGLKLPSTADWIMGFTRAGTDALGAVGGWRGQRGGTPVRGRSYQQPYDPGHVDYGRWHDPDAVYHPPYEPDPPRDHFPPDNPPPPSDAVPSNVPPDHGPRVGEIRPIDDRFDAEYTSAIVNPASTDVPLRYLLDGESFELPPGHYQFLGRDRSWEIEFDRGGRFGHQRYEVGDGLFTFTPTRDGWELVRGGD
ncbi:MAG TPA: hypothetical protein VMY42_01505 [Thermoguttaceae bacterium]|nr:hypothetical protein [Thermoguttaceae bacterium]